MRILWTPFHRTLANFEVPALLSTGHEVIPLPLGEETATFFGVSRERAADIPVPWRNTQTIPPGDLERILRVDLYNLFRKTGTTQQHEHGNVGRESAALINKYFDAIFVASYPSVVPGILKWFDGVVVFRLYGNQDPQFRLVEWCLDSFPNSGIAALYNQRDRYLCSPILHGLLQTEESLVLGENPIVLGAYSDPTRFGAVRWNAERSGRWVSTNVSYLHDNASWRSEYEAFETAFRGVEFRVYGKNQLDKLPFNDNRVQARIDDDNKYYSELAKARVLCVVGRNKSHSQYTPGEGLYLGMPVLFHEESGFSFELSRHFARDELRSRGMCRSYTEMAERATELLGNITSAKELAASQTALKTNGPFNFNHVERQAQRLCDEIATRLNRIKSVESRPAEVRRSPVMYWAIIHETLRSEEVPLLQNAGFGVIPARITAQYETYHGSHYDDACHSSYPRGWERKVGLPSEVIAAIQRINLLEADDVRTLGTLTQREINLLNEFVGCVVVPAHVPTALNLMKCGYNGVVMLRYFGHYVPGCTRTSETRHLGYDYSSLRKFPNYLWVPGLTALSELEDPVIAKDGNRNLLFATRSLEKHGVTWAAESSQSCVLTVISAADSHLKHYYVNFKEHFKDIPHAILGKNDPSKFADSSVVGRIESNETYLNRFKNARVYVDPGFVPQHSHFTALESLQLGVPVLFERRSGVFRECLEVMEEKRVFELGGCGSFSEAKSRAVRCLEDASYAIDLADRQGVLLREVFNRTRAERQAKALFERVEQYLNDRTALIPRIDAARREPMARCVERSSLSGNRLARNVLRFIPRTVEKVKSYLKRSA